MENKFNFDEMTRRRETASLKWDTMPDAEIIPLWVADMDFRTAPAITEALQRRVASGIFGYVDVPDSYFHAVTSWFERRHDWHIDRESLIYTPGVVPALSAIIKALTIPGDGVILQTPAYNCFFSSIRNNGCREADNPLLRRDTPSGFTFEFDFNGLERLAADPRNKLMILCNPHNPTGRIWTRRELEKVMEICRRHNVHVISDEIHCELTHDNRIYIPYATVDPEAIVCCSPSKAFNTAGLQIANIVCPDSTLRTKIDRAVNDNEVCDVNPFGVDGLIAAYNYGAEWLDALRGYLDENFNLLRQTLTSEIAGWTMCDSEATYLAWVDVSATGLTGDETERLLLEEAKVKVSSGSIYGASDYIRINYACPRSRLEEALRRISEVCKLRN